MLSTRFVLLLRFLGKLKMHIINVGNSRLNMLTILTQEVFFESQIMLSIQILNAQRIQKKWPTYSTVGLQISYTDGYQVWNVGMIENTDSLTLFNHTYSLAVLLYFINSLMLMRDFNFWLSPHWCFSG